MIYVDIVVVNSFKDPLLPKSVKFTNKGLTDAVSVIQSLPKAISGIVWGATNARWIYQD